MSEIVGIEVGKFLPAVSDACECVSVTLLEVYWAV